MKRRTCLLAAICFSLVFGMGHAAFAVVLINASGSPTGPFASTSYGLSGGSFVINENVGLDPGFSPWQKGLNNDSGAGIASGVDKSIVETLTNLGAVPWTDWHESIVTRTTINNPNDSPGFLFDSSSLVLQANYGSGLVTLTQNIDYTVTATAYSGPSFSGNNGNWEAIDIFLSPSAAILPGETLQITKSIFEVFGDGNIWQTDEIAGISEYPTPEPASLSLCTIGALSLFVRRRRTIAA